MKKYLFLPVIAVIVFFISFTKSEPGFNGTTPGCGGSGCHTSENGIVTTEVLSNFQVRITVSGTTSNVGGELVNSQGTVVAFVNSTSNNPFTLTAPDAGTYTVNAGFKSPSRKWGTAQAVINLTGVDEDLVGLAPSDFALYPNYPNPFNPATTIRYAIPQTSFTSIKVYNLIGEEVLTLIDEIKSPGIYELHFDSGNLTSGTYFYRLQAGNFVQTKKMILMK